MQEVRGNAKCALLFWCVTALECGMAEGAGLAERGVESRGGRKLGKNARNAHVYPAFHWGGGSPPQPGVYKGSPSAAGESERSESSWEKQQSAQPKLKLNSSFHSNWIQRNEIALIESED